METPCPTCHGTGFERKSKSLTINIPAGVDDDTVLPLRGEGEAGERSGEPGDVYIFISVKPHEYYTREGKDIFLEMPITFAQAALGAEIAVPTLYGKVKLKIAAGTQSGQ